MVNLNNSTWIYNSTLDTALFYGVKPESLKSKDSNVNIEQDAKGADYLLVKEGEINYKVHIFARRNFFTKIKYWILKHLSNNWTEVKLHKPFNANNIETYQPQEITILIDNKELIKNPNLYFKITSIFEFAFRTQNSILENTYRKSIPFTEEYLQKKEIEAIKQRWKAYPYMQQLFIKLTELSLKDEVNKAYALELNVFGLHYKEYVQVKLKNKDPLSDDFHQEMVSKMLDALSKITSLPEEFKEIGQNMKLDLVSNIYDYFYAAFTSTTKDQTINNQLNLLETCQKNVLKHIESVFSNSEEDKKIINDQLAFQFSTTQRIYKNHL